MDFEKETADNLNIGEIKISVRNLVEFILRSGDIDNRHQGSTENAMAEGSRIHRMIQKRMGSEYKAEVPLRFTYPTKKYVLIVEGRADGIIDTDTQTLVDEIKGTYRELHKIKEPVPVHLAQAKCYAYMYALQKKKEEIQVRMTYCNLDTEEIRYFHKNYTFEELAEWFGNLVQEYRRWADYSWEWKEIRQTSLEQLEFPFPYREGQKELVSYVYSSIYHGRKLFLEAPTGVGKTISTVFPALKAMSKGMGERLFYFTAKTITRTVAENTFALLRKGDLRFKSVVLTAKEKICFQEQTECNPDACPYAKGHFDRINDALYKMITTEDSFDRSVIERYAQEFMVCPFELCLDASLFADGVIGDYNYLFDPHVYLKRFFMEGNTGDYLFLIDEAHNLLERGREMYSATLVKETFLELKNSLKILLMGKEKKKKNSKKNEDPGQKTLFNLDLTNEEMQISSGPQTGRNSILVREGYGERIMHHLEKCNKAMLDLKRECDGFSLVDEIDGFVQPLSRLWGVLGEYLEQTEEDKPDVREELLDLYFDVSHFLDIYERLDDHYVKYCQLDERGDFMLKLFCVNPAKNLKECMDKGRSSILFSATFLPIQYYKSLLGGENNDYEVYAKSVFKEENRALFVATDVTSKYTRRSEEEFSRIAEYISRIVSAKAGNYMVFCPSHAFLQQLYEIYQYEFASGDQECLLQQDYMSEEGREEFLARFRGNEDLNVSDGLDLGDLGGMEIEEEEDDRTLIGFCVLGGIFGEGIDLKKDSLIGAIIVGTGLPQVCNEREILKDYFDEEGNNGFDYAYRYPGMNKVLQAAGRVIRTVDDVGVIALLDERFLQPTNLRLFPREWSSFERVNISNVQEKIENFWQENGN